MLKSFLIVGLGSFLGGGLRFLLSRVVTAYVQHPFPLATWLVNILGCLAIGFFYGNFEQSRWMNSDLRLFLTVGLCGGFTTFSTFMNENLYLIRSGNFYCLALYIVLSLLVGLLCLCVGYYIGKGM